MCSGLLTGEIPEKGILLQREAKCHLLLDPCPGPWHLVPIRYSWVMLDCSALKSVLEHCLSPSTLRTSYVSSYSTSVLFIGETISLCAPHWECGELLIPVFLIMVFVILDANTHFLSTDAAFLAMEFSFFFTCLDKTVVLPQTFSLQCWFYTSQHILCWSNSSGFTLFKPRLSSTLCFT